MLNQFDTKKNTKVKMECVQCFHVKSDLLPNDNNLENHDHKVRVHFKPANFVFFFIEVDIHLC